METVYVKLVGFNGYESVVTMQVNNDNAILILQDEELESYGIVAENGSSRLIGDTSSRVACFIRSFEQDEPGTKVYHGDMRIRSKLSRALSEEPANLEYEDGRGWLLTWKLGPSSV